MAAGIFEITGWVGTAVVVAPIALLGLDFLFRGNYLGGVAFLGIVGLILAIERYVVTPEEIPKRVASRFVSAIVTTEDTDDQ